MRIGKPTRAAIASILLSAGYAAIAEAQVAGSWAGSSTGSWLVGANWSSNPDFPTAGGTAVFNAGAASVTVNSFGVTLRHLKLDTASQINIQGNSISLTGAPLIEIARSKQSAPGTNYYLGHEISANLSFLESFPGPPNPNFHVTGPGALVIRATANHYYTHTQLDGGVQYGITNSSAFGASSASILINNGTLRSLSPTGTLTTTPNDVYRSVQILPGGGTISGITAPARVTQPIVGGGPLSFGGPAGVILTANNTWAGAARVAGGGTSSLTIENNGALPFYNSLEVSGQLNVNYGSTTSDKLGFGTLALRGGTANLIQYNGTEQIGTLVLAGGQNVINTLNATSGTFTLQSAAVVRQDRATLIVRADGLGVAPPANRVSRIFFDDPSGLPLVGGGGAAGSTNISIVPFATHNFFSTNSFLRYDPSVGLRPLNLNTEFLTALPAASISTANVRLNSAVVNSPQTINALLLNSGATISGPATLTVASGAILNSGTSGGAVISCPLDFGAAEGVLTNITTLNGPISGTNGITSTGGITLNSDDSTYTGVTTVNGAFTVNLTSDLVPGVPGKLGADTSPIVLVGRGMPSMLTVNGNRNFARDVLVRSDPELLKGFEPLLRASGTFSGAIELEGPLRIESVAGGRFTGHISGPGRLIIDGVAAGGTATLSGTSSFQGGVHVAKGGVVVLNDSALGTGTLYVGDGPLPGGTGNTITLDTAIGPTPAVRVIANPILLMDDLRFADPGTLTLAGPIDLNGEQRTLIMHPGLRTLISGPIFGGELIWSGGIGTFSGNNAQRATALSGLLTVTSDHALGAQPFRTEVGTLLSPGGATLELHGGVSIPAHPMTLAGELRSAAGANAWLGPVLSPSAATFHVTSDTLTIAGGVNGGTQTVGIGAIKTGPGTLATKNFVSPRELRIDEGLVQILPNGATAATSRAGSLTIAGAPDAWTARLDLSDNAFIIDYDVDSPIETVANQLKAGYANGSWNGNGIASSAAAATANRALGYAEAADLGVGTFAGQSVDATAVVIAYTITGDANLDRIVDIGDFSLLAANFNLPGGWFRGDFDYDGQTGIGDFALLAANFNVSAADAPRSAIPEPGTMIVAPAVLLLVGGRNWKGRSPCGRDTRSSRCINPTSRAPWVDARLGSGFGSVEVRGSRFDELPPSSNLQPHFTNDVDSTTPRQPQSPPSPPVPARA